MSVTRIHIFDYGAGNLHSLAKTLEREDVEVRVESDPARAVDGDALVLPGVGAFEHAAARLAPARDRMRDALRAGLPCLGVCLGMQLLFDESEEGPGRGLGVVSGRVTRLRARRVPQIGWNQLEEMRAGEPLFARAPLDVAYFANSFACRPAPDDPSPIAWATHETDHFVAAVRVGNTVGVQFHPEKSSSQGVAFVQAWVTEARRLSVERGARREHPESVSGPLHAPRSTLHVPAPVASRPTESDPARRSVP